jgi:hypothetical protein
MRGNHSPTKVFRRVDNANPGRSVFDLSHRKLLSTDFGKLTPVLCEEVYPGDYFNISHQLLVRFNPLVAPIMHEINAYIHVFNVPYRLLWPKPDYENNPPELEAGNWENFITGGTDGLNDDTIPIWNPSGAYTGAVKSLWDYFGFPTGIAVPVGSQPCAFPKRAYNLIYNEYYRDETLIDPVDLDQNDVLYRSWEKDYFTSALPWQQRGDAPALPVNVTLDLETDVDSTASIVYHNLIGPASGMTTPRGLFAEADNAASLTFGPDDNGGTYTDAVQNFKDIMDGGEITVDNDATTTGTASATSLDIAEIRLAFQIQKFLERNARAGARYIEFIKGHFGASPRDDRLQRPEYIGGIKAPIIVSEVLQTSETDGSPQGNMAGHGITVDNSHAGNYRVQEHGVIIAILSIMPRTMYQQGIDRNWTRRTRYDFYFPEFAHLSEQAILNNEIFTSADNAVNNDVFGYQGRYDELRFRRSMVTSDFRSTFDYWHLGRQFSALPSLNGNFISITPTELTELKRVFAVPSEDGILVSVGNLVIANRPMPIMPVPGYVDH